MAETHYLGLVFGSKQPHIGTVVPFDSDRDAHIVEFFHFEQMRGNVDVTYNGQDPEVAERMVIQEPNIVYVPGISFEALEDLYNILSA